MRASDVFEPYPGAPRLLEWLESRFGLSAEVFADHRFWQRPGAKTIWIASAAFEPPADFPVEALGMMVMRKPPPAGKLTSTFLQRFGASATRNTLRLEGEQLATFIRREPQPMPGCRGYQIVFAGDQVLGAGFVKDGVLKSELPKSWTVSLTL